MRCLRPIESGNQELASFLEPRWYAVYTCAHREKRVADQLINHGVDHFLPRYESVRKWRDRSVRLQLPLFPGYVFVHLALRDRLQVLQVPGVVKLVGFNGQPEPLPESDITGIRNVLMSAYHIEPHSYIEVGRRVRVLNGPLIGMEGIVVRRKNRTRLVISLDLIQRSVSVEVSEMNLDVVAKSFPISRLTVPHA
jgi:transcription antitermination factor NusG